MSTTDDILDVIDDLWDESSDDGELIREIEARVTDAVQNRDHDGELDQTPLSIDAITDVVAGKVGDRANTVATARLGCSGKDMLDVMASREVGRKFGTSS